MRAARYTAERGHNSAQVSSSAANEPGAHWSWAAHLVAGVSVRESGERLVVYNLGRRLSKAFWSALRWDDVAVAEKKQNTHGDRPRSHRDKYEKRERTR